GYVFDAVLQLLGRAAILDQQDVVDDWPEGRLVADDHQAGHGQLGLHPLQRVGGHRVPVVREQDAAGRRGPFEDSGVFGVPQAHLPHPDEVEAGATATGGGADWQTGGPPSSARPYAWFSGSLTRRSSPSASALSA